MKTRIRKAVPEDLPILNQISIESKRYWGYPEKWIQNWLNDLNIDEKDIQQQEVRVLQVADKLAGFCSIAEDVDAYEVMHLWVLPKYIGKGYGKLLLNESIASAVISNKKIRVEADPNAENFYKSQGFITIEKVESFPKGRFLPVMQKLN